MSTLKVSTIAPLGTDATKTVTLGASGDTLSIPSGCTISNSGTASGFGKLLQQVTTEISDQTNLATTSFADLTGFTASITPTSSSSKIIFIASLCVNHDTTNVNNGLKVQLYNTTDSASQNIFVLTRYNGASADYIYNHQTVYFSVNSWGTTARSYKLQGAGIDNTNSIIVNRTDAFSAPGRGHFIIQEIA